MAICRAHHRSTGSLMLGGPKIAYDLVAPIFSKTVAQVHGPCVGRLGPIGAGNYVKMVLSGIECSDKQLVAEAYDVMKHVLNMSNEEMADQFDAWNKTELNSSLMEITATILRKKEGDTYVVDSMIDTAGLKVTE
jgi:6-phosphogluconate dehydrogenase